MPCSVVAVPPILLPVSVASPQNPPKTDPFKGRQMKHWFTELLLPLVLLAATLGFAQRPQGNAPQVGEVSTDTLNIGLTIPVVSKKGVGLPFSFNLYFNNNFWLPVEISTGPTVWEWEPGWPSYPITPGWALTDYFGNINTITIPKSQMPCGLNQPMTFYTGYTDAQGSFHRFGSNSPGYGILIGSTTGSVGTGCESNTDFYGTMSDGTGISYALHYSSNNTITTKSGIVITPSGVQPGNVTPTIVDAHQNTFTISTTNPAVVTDTFNTQPLSYSSGYCQAATPTLTYTYPSGSSNTVTVSCGSHTIQTSWSTACSTQRGTTDYPATAAYLVDSITLADNSEYKFTYKGNGQLASVQYPSGATTTYTYSGVSCYDGTPQILTRTTAEGQWTFTRSNWQAYNTWLTDTVVDPSGNATAYTFSMVNNILYAAPTALVQVQQNQGASTLLKTTVLCYDGNQTSCATATAPNIPWSQVDTYVTYTGAASSTRTTQFFDSYGNTMETDVYTFGASTPSFKTFAYNFGQTWNGSTSAPACTASIGNSIMDKPCQVQKTDGSGNQLQNTYVAYNSTGDATSVATLVGSNYLTTTNTYNSNGTLATTKDPNGNVTTLTFGACNGGLLTKHLLANGLYITTGWDSGCWGVLTSWTDLNGNTSTAEYNDPFYRQTQRTDPLSNSTNLTYGYNPPSSESILNWGSSTQDAYSQTNPSALTSYAQAYDPVNSNWDTVESAYYYGSYGIVSTKSMPCATTKGSGCTNGLTTTYYDALGRVLAVADGGGGSIDNTYVVSTSCASGLSACFIRTSELNPTPSGELTKQVATETDGLGRIVATCAVSSNQGGTCGFGGYSGILTTVVYNSTGTVASITRGSQGRSFSYDATGRVTWANTPEIAGGRSFYYDSLPSGSICNQLQSAGILPANASPLGNLLDVFDSNGTTTCYSYDKLGRVIAIAYDSAAPNFDGANKYFVYDSSTVNGVSVGRQGYLAEAYTAATISATKITDEGFLYTVRGELSDVYQWSTNSGVWYHTTATYAANGVPLSLTAANSLLGGTWTYTLDGKGRPITAVLGTTNEVTGVTYNAANQPLVVTLGLGDKDTYAYDTNTGRMSTYDFAIKATPVHFTGTLSWNANGTLNGLTVVDGINAGADSETCSYTNSSGTGYDEFSRLLGVNCVNGSTKVWGQNFTYDQYDNLSKSVQTGYPGVNWLPTYNTANNQYSAATYDANGNMLTDTFHTYTWNQDNKVKVITDAGISGILYDAFGRRVEWLTGSTYSQILMSPLGPVALMSKGATTQYRIPLPGGDTAVNGINFEHTDHLGNVPFISNRNRTSTGARLFAPYGESYNSTGITGDLNFTGDFQDFTAGVYDTPNRELTANAGRWNSPDPAGASWNAYAYSTNPMGETDPTGLFDINDQSGIFGSNPYHDLTWGGNEAGYNSPQVADVMSMIDENDILLGTTASPQSWGGDWTRGVGIFGTSSGFGGLAVLGVVQSNPEEIPGMYMADCHACTPVDWNAGWTVAVTVWATAMDTDFIQLSGSAGPVSLSLSWTHSNVYLSPGYGKSLKKSFPLASLSLTANWMDNRKDVDKYLKGPSVQVSAFYGFGVSQGCNFTGCATGFGIGTPSISVGGSAGIPLIVPQPSVDPMPQIPLGDGLYYTPETPWD